MKRKRSKQEYVVGFNFVRPPEPNAPWQVVLIQKRRPKWQAGKLNGVGGHVEPGEYPADAMAREYHEETGDGHNAIMWERFLTLETHDAIVHFFKDFNMWTAAHTRTDEPVHVVQLEPLLLGRLGKLQALPNLYWLISMALSGDGGHLKLKQNSCR